MLIFLDFDDVICTDKSYRSAFDWHGIRLPPQDGAPGLLASWFDSEPVKLINKTFRDYKPSIVIASSWRRHFSLSTLTKTLEIVGLEFPVDGVLPTRLNNNHKRRFCSERGDVIELYLEINELDPHDLVVIDDDTGWIDLKDRWVAPGTHSKNLWFDGACAARAEAILCGKI